MAKLGLFTIISVLINLFLTFWLINQYMSDVYFQVYVNGTIGQYYPFIVLTLGIGGGSGVGYLFLKRKHGDGSLVGKIQKSKNFKPAGPFTTTTVSAPKPVLPSGAPPAPVSKHTAYAVPPLPKASTPSSSRGTTPTTWAASSPSKSALDSILAPKLETTPRPSISEIPTRSIEPSKPVSSPFQSQTVTQPPQPLRLIGEPGTKQAPSWTQQPSQFGERRQEPRPVFQKPGMDIGAKQDSSFSGFSNQPQTPQSAPVPSKWAPPEDKSGTGQWSEGGVKSIPPLPTKWSPPSGAPPPQDRSQAPSFPRPSPIPARSPIPPPQGGPRPFVIQGPGGPTRPDQQRPLSPPRPIAAPQPFRPDPNRPPPGIGGQPRPSQPLPRPAAPLGGPMPQPWTPGQTPEKKESPSFGFSGSSTTTAGEAPAGKPATEQKTPPEGSGGGEMDWDTALDTILKTLRKDRVGDTK
ncbi:MAG TPA: hypothetical protein VE955_00255 [Candidatus Dormibacteraeota bacterium]|nr:hypothetical protein [Candidatus Dormibacteraeota bacterium]